MSANLEREPSTKAARRSGYHNLNVEQRRQVLASDPDAVRFSETSVHCRFCDRSITLDTRGGSAYYLGFWNKHKATNMCRLNKMRYLNVCSRAGISNDCVLNIDVEFIGEKRR
jgi:hypothetical protein